MVSTPKIHARLSDVLRRPTGNLAATVNLGNKMVFQNDNGLNEWLLAVFVALQL
jgi:hypothetical protein